MRKGLLIGLAGLLVVGGVLGWQHYGHRLLPAAAPPARSGPPPAVPVVLATAAVKPVPLVLSAIGRVQPINAVAVRPRVEGEILEVHFEEGREVQAGDLLFTLDSRQAEIALKQAEAVLARDQAQMASARADLKRYSELAKSGYASSQKQEQSVASTAVLEATLMGDQAAVDRAKLDLEYALVRAPIAGRTGAVAVKLGNLVKPDDSSPLVTITQLRPITVAFALPERYLPALKRYQALAPLSVKVKIPHGNEAGIRGRLSFIDNAIDAASGTIAVKALFDNADGVLWPGAFVDVAVTLTVENDALVVPLAAVESGQDGRHVFVVKPDATVEQRTVRVAREAGAEAVIAAGLQPGDRVVVEGQLRLSPGARVVDRTPKAAPAPAAVSEDDTPS
ncbi:MAG: efflux RND transporter periplasmic adaptor subunit [Dongiaceae bacterium]